MNAYTLNEVLNTESFNSKIAKKIQNARKMADITQDEMATSMGGSKNHISALERGVNKITLQAFLVYCVKCGVSPNEILGWTDDSEVVTNKKEKIHLTAMQNDEKSENDAATTNAKVVELPKADEKVSLSMDFLERIMSLPEDERKKMIDLLHFAKESENK